MKEGAVLPHKIKKVEYSTIFGYYALLLGIWFASELMLYPVIDRSFSLIQSEMIENVYKSVIWFVPAFLLIKKYNDELAIELDEMLKPKKMLRTVGPFVLLFLAYILFGQFIRLGHLGISENFKPILLIGSVLVAGIAEEVVFRGFILNALVTKMKKWPAMLITALLFLVVHFPIWMYHGIFVSNLLTGTFVLIMALSVLFSWAFLKSKTIFVPILLHMCWNLFINLFT